MDCRNRIPSLPTALASGIIEDWTDRNFFALYPESCPGGQSCIAAFWEIETPGWPGIAQKSTLFAQRNGQQARLVVSKTQSLRLKVGGTPDGARTWCGNCGRFFCDWAAGNCG